MNKRQLEILKILYGNRDYITFSYLAERLEVSVKTIRNDIASIKEILAERGAGSAQTKPNAGVRLIMTEEEWHRLRSESETDDAQIIFYIIRQLLKTGSLTAQKLAEKYYIGRTQLDKLLDYVGEWFFENHILFERRRGKGISIQASEFNFRLASLAFYNEYIPFYAKLINVGEARYSFASAEEHEAMCAALSGFEPDEIADVIGKAEQKLGFCFTYASGVNLLFLTALSILRIKKGYEVKTPETIDCPISGTSAAEFVDLLIERLEEIYKITFSDEERKFLIFSLEVSEIQGFDSDEARRRYEAKNIELCRLTVKAVNLISEIADVDLREDKFFVKQMFLQLKTSISRLKYGITAKNRLLSEIKTQYPNMMAIAWFLGNIFEKELGLELNEHEVGFIALQTGGAIERHLSGFDACIVCDYGIGISQILKEKISRAIPEIRITAVYSGRDMHKIKQEQCDFIIASTPLDSYRLNREVITVGHLLDEKDIKKLEEYMKKLRVKRVTGVKAINPNTSLFTDELIFPKCRISNKKELLHMMCSRLENLGYVTEAFEKTVLEREASTPTDIGKGFALPHGLSGFVNHSVAAFATLEKPIEWTEGGEFTDKILLLAFDLDEDENVKNQIIRFYKSVVTFMEDDTECERLANLTDIKQIKKILELW